MKIFSILFILLVSFQANSQFSYDFSIPLPPGSTPVKSVAKPYFGTFSSDQIDIDYEFNDQGIWAIATIYNSISRETIRESSKYKVKDDFLFGVTEEDSIPCVLQGEYYHFAVRHKELIVGENSKNVLTKLSETRYLINFENEGNFTPSLIEFTGKTMNIRHFNYEEDAQVFNSIVNRTEKITQQMVYIVLEPTVDEWKALPLTEILGETILFERVKK